MDLSVICKTRPTQSSFFGLVMCLSTLLMASVSAAQQTSSEAKAKIKTILQDQAHSWNNGDIDQFMEHYWKSPNLTFSSSGKVVRGWQATIERYKAKYSTREKMGRLKFDQLEIRMLGDSASLVLGNWHLTRKDDNPQGNFSLIFRKIDGQWKIIHDHTSSLEETN